MKHVYTNSGYENIQEQIEFLKGIVSEYTSGDERQFIENNEQIIESALNGLYEKENIRWLRYGYGDELARLALNTADGVMDEDSLNTINKIIDIFQYCIDNVVPYTFTYSGVTFRNHDHLGPNIIRAFMEKAAVAFGMMKKAGVNDRAFKQIRYIDIVLYEESKLESDNNYGFANYSDSTIAFDMHEFHKDPDFLIQAMIHEIGHIIQFSMKKVANEFWGEQPEEIRRRYSLTEQEGDTFWNMLVKSGFNPKFVIESLNGESRTKFRLWIGNSGTFDTYGNVVNNKQVLDMVKDPEGYCKKHFDEMGVEFDECVANAENAEQYLEDEFKSFNDVGISSFNNVNDVPDWFRDEYDSIYEQYGFPTYYAMKNGLEDFAETFVSYVMNPGSMSENARYRMRHALWLEGFYSGKDVMKISSWYI